MLNGVISERSEAISVMAIGCQRSAFNYMYGKLSWVQFRKLKAER